MKEQCYLGTEEEGLIEHKGKENYELSNFWAGFKEL